MFYEHCDCVISLRARESKRANDVPQIIHRPDLSIEISPSLFTQHLCETQLRKNWSSGGVCFVFLSFSFKHQWRERVDFFCYSLQTACKQKERGRKMSWKKERIDCRNASGKLTFRQHTTTTNNNNRKSVVFFFFPLFFSLSFSAGVIGRALASP